MITSANVFLGCEDEAEIVRVLLLTEEASETDLCVVGSDVKVEAMEDLCFASELDEPS